MASSATEVVNLALVRIGHEPIAALDDSSAAARVATRLYPQARDEYLRLANWNFAQTRVALAAVDPDPAWGDLFAYQLPTDCLMVLETNLDPGHAWRIEGRRLVTAEPLVSILYVARIDDPAQWDALFTEALVDKLAFLFAMPLKSNAQLAEVLLRKAEDSLKRAKSRDGQEGRQRNNFVSDAFTRSR